MAESWKNQMVLVWASQFLSIMGFAFALPFAAFFLQQELGVVRQAELKMWVGLFSASAAGTMAIAAPFWGMLADRYGKRIMLVRANLAGAVAMSLMGAVETPAALIALRLLQGALTGTMTAAQTYLAGSTPIDRRGLAMGGLSAAVFSGSMAGAFAGGWIAHWLGYRTAFFCSGLLLLAAGILVMALSRDRPALPPPAADRPSSFPARSPLSAKLWGVLAMIGAIAFVRQSDMAFLPLLVQDVHGSMDQVSIWSGSLYACGSVAGLLAGLSTGWLSDHVKPLRLVVFAALLAALFGGSQMLVHSFAVLFPVRFFAVLFGGALEPALNSWLAKHIPVERQGLAFGLASTTRSAGWALGPIAAGAIAAVNLRAVFGAAALGHLCLALLFTLALRAGLENATTKP